MYTSHIPRKNRYCTSILLDVENLGMLKLEQVQLRLIIADIKNYCHMTLMINIYTLIV